MSVAGEKYKAERGGLGETVKIVIQALLIAVVVRTFLFQPFNIPSGSMKATLLVGDYLFVSKYAYGFSKYSLPFSPDLFTGRIWASPPKRGDVAVFRLPRDPSVDYIKRVIGLPGDKIQMIDGVLQINGQAVKKEKVDDYTTTDEFGTEVRVPRFRETLPDDKLPNGSIHKGISYEVLDLDPHSMWDDTPIYEVPPDHYFMMGDNRDNSTDSRVLAAVGYVPFENFVGRAELVFFSVKEGDPAWQFWRWPWTVRFDRIFKTI
ncbi:signal peptidase I [Kaistia algarum]|uniref:signal peptidase I n=1 Tax=Kaistia algarum TaxID=2083279 RepID=UPI000CE8ADBD|nr:signal peptidase I [Kaistia algarum]MCX5515152.1 signal peptidase I [Kaistia algarum]PPE79873.1 signal peptidase I [Kaistia algarum]